MHVCCCRFMHSGEVEAEELRAAVYGNEMAQNQVLKKMNVDRGFLKKLLFPVKTLSRDSGITGGQENIRALS